MNRRAGAASPAMRNQVVAGQQRRHDRVVAVGGRGERGDALVRGDVEVIGRQRADLRRELRAAGRGDLIGVEADRQAEPAARLAGAPALIGVEHALLAEDVAERARCPAPRQRAAARR